MNVSWVRPLSGMEVEVQHSGPTRGRRNSSLVPAVASE